MGKSSKKKYKREAGEKEDRPGAYDENLKIILSYEHLSIKEVDTYDGDSFFRAVSDQVFGSQNNYIEVKARVLEFVQLNRVLVEEKNAEKKSDIGYVKEIEEIRAAGFVYEKNIRIFIAKENDITETYPSDSWIYLSKSENGAFGSVRYINDLGDTIPNNFTLFYETDKVRKERKEKMKILSEYFIRTFNIINSKKLTWILMKLFLYDATYNDIENSYEKLVYYLEKFNN